MNEHVAAAIEGIRRNNSASASELLERAVRLLRQIDRGELGAAGRALCRAQPCMASIWNAVAAALDSPAELERFAERATRRNAAIARFARDALLAERANGAAALHLVAYSSSGVVLATIETLSREREIVVSCSEARPVLEGRAFAERLAGAGVRIEFYTDAALGTALKRATAVVIGADAIAPDWFVNKAGTCAIAAAACDAGVPVYVLAGRDKWVHDTVARLMEFREGEGTEIWEAPPPRVRVRNPYFESIPSRVVSGFVSDVGLLSPDMMREAGEIAPLQKIKDRLVLLLGSKA
ncbi:MAG: hypothetical protein HYX76_05220 [Acidobacteria bacterium]|nr:hypothetical protein [Acidobacteriota bacterium]